MKPCGGFELVNFQITELTLSVRLCIIQLSDETWSVFQYRIKDDRLAVVTRVLPLGYVAFVSLAEAIPQYDFVLPWRNCWRTQTTHIARKRRDHRRYLRSKSMAEVSRHDTN